jgi:outer membrane scaffolding protein for murein synthesis (MipA/OmpV family)
MAVLGAAVPGGRLPAAEKPLWEAGMGVAVLSIPDYRGSDEQRSHVLPLPYLVYRGEVVKVDREGVHGRLFGSDRVKLELSLGAGPPAKSNENEARRDMPDIDPTLETGPELRIELYASEARDRQLTLRLPVRAVIATDLSHWRYIGWVFSPHLNYDALRLGAGWNVGLAVGPLYASERNHDYYYEVAPEYATVTRPAYDARGGYSGSRVTVAVSRRFPRYWIGAFARYDTLSNAVFEASPLVRKKHSFMAGFGVSWVFARSSRTVWRPDIESNRAE